MIKPINDRVLLQEEEPRKVSSGGIYLVHSPSPVVYATVKAIGVNANTVAVGDRVFYHQYLASQIENSLAVIKESDILGIDNKDAA